MPPAASPTSARFDGPAEFKRAILARKDQFARALTEHLFTYALGRDPEWHDDTTVQDHRPVAFDENDYRFSELIIGIVASALLPNHFQPGSTP